MRILHEDGSIIDPANIREFGGILLPNCDDDEVGRAYVEVRLPQIKANIESDNRDFVRWLGEPEVVVGNPAHTFGPHPPYGWYGMIEVKGADA